MIQLNLLPDVKLEYIKAQRERKLLTSISIIVILVTVCLLALLLVTSFYQKTRINSLSNSIDAKGNQLKNKPEISKILTVQNQLESLTELHAKKPAASNIFNYLNQVTPANVAINSFVISFVDQKITITGGSDNLQSANKYIDTLKFTKYTSDSVHDGTPAFSNVVMTTFALNTKSTDVTQAATYTITLNYDPNIFDISQQAKLVIPPHFVTTRSELGAPTELFKASANNTAPRTQ
jgi:Tfp pilus assembly protein PilN